MSDMWTRTPYAVCRRAMTTADCPYSHRWGTGLSNGIPYGGPDHQTLTGTSWVSRARQGELPFRVTGGAAR